MNIREFLRSDDIQKLIEEENLDKIYTILMEQRREIPPSELTAFFIKNNIDHLRYMSTVPVLSYNRLPIKDIVIPNTISKVDDGAFIDCNELTQVEFEEGTDMIGTWAFKGCSELENIKLPNTLTHIFSQAFRGCTSLQKIILPDNIEYFGISHLDTALV